MIPLLICRDYRMPFVKLNSLSPSTPSFLTKPHFTLNQNEKVIKNQAMAGCFLAKGVFQHVFQRPREAGKDQEGPPGPICLSADKA